MKLKNNPLQKPKEKKDAQFLVLMSTVFSSQLAAYDKEYLAVW